MGDIVELTTDRICPLCGARLNNWRHKNAYCSKKCELAAIRPEVKATSAWRPLAIEPITHVMSARPVMVFSDIHAPLHSEKWIEQGLRVAEKYGSRKLIVNGDFIDANQISKHMGGYYRRKGELNDDFAAGEALIKLFEKYFDEIYFLAGNHCLQRLTKVFGGEVAAQRIWKLFGDSPKVKVSARSYVYVNEDVICGHPRSYSRIRGNLAQKIAMNKQKSVILGHLHHSASTTTPDGKWQACEVGSMADLEDFEYTQFEVNDMPQPVHGFAMIVKNRIVLFDAFTPWDLFGLPSVT